jgi:c-di-GMP-binding flagellar brake protein YcgR
MSDDIEKLLHHYFPASTYSISDLAENIEKGRILTKEEEILPFLLTALLDEKVLEVELNQSPDLYFSRLQDDIAQNPTTAPPPVTEDQKKHELPEYMPGDYLLNFDHILTLPLEPGLGSLRLRQSATIMLRMFTKDFGVEMGTRFQDIVKVNDLPILQLAYPSIIRIQPNAREFRAKVSESQDFIVEVEGDNHPVGLTTTPIDISRKGMALAIEKNIQKQLKVDDELFLKLFIEDELRARLSGTVRHLSRVRKRSGIEYSCGVEFKLTSKTITSVMESIVAATQRVHLKELAEIAASRGIDIMP